MTVSSNEYMNVSMSINVSSIYRNGKLRNVALVAESCCVKSYFLNLVRTGNVASSTRTRGPSAYKVRRGFIIETFFSHRILKMPI